MGRLFDKRRYESRLSMLTKRAKQSNGKTDDLDIGESCYLLSLIGAVRLFRMKCMSADELFHEQKRLEQELLRYYQHCELFDLHIEISSRCSEILTEAVKHGCPICKRLVRVFDGRIVEEKQKGENIL